MTAYRVRTGLNYTTSREVDAQLRAAADLPDEDRQRVVDEARAKGQLKRAEPGEVVTDLPDGSIPWLLAQGLIELAVLDPEQPSTAEPGETTGPLGPAVTPIGETPLSTPASGASGDTVAAPRPVAAPRAFGE